MKRPSATYQMQFLRWHPRWRLWTPAKHPTQSENSWESISATPFWDDSTKKDTSLGKCSWFSEIGSYPANLGTTDNGAAPCKYQAVVAEYTLNGTSAYPSMVCQFWILSHKWEILYWIHVRPTSLIRPTHGQGKAYLHLSIQCFITTHIYEPSIHQLMRWSYQLITA